MDTDTCSDDEHTPPSSPEDPIYTSFGGGCLLAPSISLSVGARSTTTTTTTPRTIIIRRQSDLQVYFRMISMGDIDLQQELTVNEKSGIIDRRLGRERRGVRRVYSAKIDGRNTDLTVAMYEGDGAQEDWRRDVKMYMSLRHPNIIQMYGTARSETMYATIFHGGATFTCNHQQIGTTLISKDQRIQFMIRSPETEAGAHPYWYCQLLGVFHANVFRVTESGATPPTPMEFLWVRWMGVEPGYRAGIKRARLPRVGFVPESDPFAFGFLDPQHILRGSHLIPDFVGGRTNELLATQAETAARAPEDTEDWATYCVDIFADSDMFMRYFGGGIGHLDLGTPQAVDEDDDDPAAEDEVHAGAATTHPEDSDPESDSSSESEEDMDGDDSGEELDDDDLEFEDEEDFTFGAD
ncbi:hypothetical protein B0H16DRAFT_637266 [Mycena metata]|uniref:Uncharacterized protein n=1 Tax=Mycena metata TaxID=1033252 RepID=A0AAD7MD47_9AGAR|nr:hypothetical protein B0H16DRAFT_637266 [Mycena metata]